jgi:hypothetical protein
MGTLTPRVNPFCYRSSRSWLARYRLSVRVPVLAVAGATSNDSECSLPSSFLHETHNPTQTIKQVPRNTLRMAGNRGIKLISKTPVRQLHPA